MGIEELIRKDYIKHNIHLVETIPKRGLGLFTKSSVANINDLKGHIETSYESGYWRYLADKT